MRHIILLGLLMAPALAWTKGPLQPLPIEKLDSLKKERCTFLHVWATWCTICLEELPKLIPLLAEAKPVTPVIVDVSSPFVQSQFSKKWTLALSAPFPMYVKPEGPGGAIGQPAYDQAYFQTIDKNWKGALPYSALYDRGKVKRTWVGALDLKTLKNEIAALCR